MKKSGANQISKKLVELFEAKKISKPGYSVRALARDLKLSPSFVSRALRGEKNFTALQLKSLFRIFDVDRETQTKLFNIYASQLAGLSVAQSFTSAGKEYSKIKFKKLPKNKLSILSHWFHIPVLEILTINDFKLEPAAVAKRLGITIQMVEESLATLEKLEIIKKTENGYARKIDKIRLSSATTKPEIRNYHSEMINRASYELRKTDEASFNLRLITGITIGSNPAKLAQAKEILNDALLKASKLLNDDDASEIYQINLQLFPLSKK